jgi:hypothetical protein
MNGHILPLPQYAIMVCTVTTSYFIITIINARMMYLRNMQEKWESVDRLDLVQRTVGGSPPPLTVELRPDSVSRTLRTGLRDQTHWGHDIP